ncbi:MAG: hypothetical protein PHX64_03250 [Candidatus Omnitrophica bacterium]|nr:hypothetical protein [Candidatus Omnitrophota bacterium]MDD5310748.1 hypothetical protein [Candidatus Omnitrophota bacterium]MDD5545569.1 hypothetical protein [Candidatus Omnitrophota bacterium]
MKKIIAFSVILFLSLCLRASAAPGDKYAIRVPGDCKTIREACEKSFPGDTIYIGAGEYTEKEGFTVKSNIKLVGQGADKTLIKLGKSGLSIISSRGSVNNVAIKDLSIEVNGQPLRVSGVDSFLLKDCVLISRNLSTCIEVSGVKNAQILNCDIVNASYGLMLWGGPIELVVRNSVFYNNKVGICSAKLPPPGNPRDLPKGYLEEYYNKPREDISLTLSYNLFYNLKDFLDCRKGEKDILLDPRFANAAKDDFHLRGDSPCVDGGDPDAKYNDPDGSRNDIGALPFAGK